MNHDPTTPEGRTRLRELAAKARAASLEPGWPFDSSGNWAGCVDGLLGGPVGEFAGAVSPDVVDALLAALERANSKLVADDHAIEVLRTQVRAYQQVYERDAPHNTGTYGIVGVIRRAETAEGALERVQALIDAAEQSPHRGVQFGGTPFPASVGTDALRAALNRDRT